MSRNAQISIKNVIKRYKKLVQIIVKKIIEENSVVALKIKELKVKIVNKQIVLLVIALKKVVGA